MIQMNCATFASSFASIGVLQSAKTMPAASRAAPTQAAKFPVPSGNPEGEQRVLPLCCQFNGEVGSDLRTWCSAPEPRSLTRMPGASEFARRQERLARRRRLVVFAEEHQEQEHKDPDQLRHGHPPHSKLGKALCSAVHWVRCTGLSGVPSGRPSRHSPRGGSAAGSSWRECTFYQLEQEACQKKGGLQAHPGSWRRRRGRGTAIGA